MIISILNPKGGTGKTTISTNLSRTLQESGEVLLLDLDPQKSAQEWAERNPDDYPGVMGVKWGNLPRIIKRVKGKFDYVLIDGAALMSRDSMVDVIKCSDIILVPVQPSGLDLWGVQDLIDLIRTQQKITGGQPKAAFIVSRQTKRTRFAQGIGQRLEGLGLPVFEARTTNLVDYYEAASGGVSVVDYNPKGNGAKEIQAITQELKNFIAQEVLYAKD